MRGWRRQAAVESALQPHLLLPHGGLPLAHSSLLSACAAALHARALECMRISTGCDHPNYRTIEGFLSLVNQFDGALIAGQRALSTAGTTTTTTASSSSSRSKAKGGRRK